MSLSAIDWVQRCKTCKHVKMSPTYGAMCSLKGSCNYQYLEPKELKEEPKGKKEPIHKRKRKKQDVDGLYICRECNNSFKKEDMYIQKVKGLEYIRFCKKCNGLKRREYQRNRYLKAHPESKREHSSKYKDVIRTQMPIEKDKERLCTHCGRILPVTFFYIQSIGNGRVNAYSHCKDCKREMSKEAYERRKALKNGKEV